MVAGALFFFLLLLVGFVVLQSVVGCEWFGSFWLVGVNGLVRVANVRSALPQVPKARVYGFMPKWDWGGRRSVMRGWRCRYCHRRAILLSSSAAVMLICLLMASPAWVSALFHVPKRRM